MPRRDENFGLKARAHPQKSQIQALNRTRSGMPLKKGRCANKHVPLSGRDEYRFNRRYDLAAMLPRLAWAAVRTPPMPYRLLKLAEVHA